MCKATKYKTSNSRIDECMRIFIKNLNGMFRFHITLSCCCGHGKYPMTVVIKDSFGHIWELFSSVTIPRKRNFYKRDSDGIYYIPETIE